MAKKPQAHLSRRERQIMNIIYERGQASAAEVLDAMEDPPSYSAVRALIGILERKGLLKHTQEGAKYIYTPTQPRDQVGQLSLRRVLQTFYGGSLEKAVAALLNASDKPSPDELDRLRSLIDKAKKEGR